MINVFGCNMGKKHENELSFQSEGKDKQICSVDGITFHENAWCNFPCNRIYVCNSLLHAIRKSGRT